MSLPGLDGLTPAKSSSTVFGEYVWKLANAPGALPAMPMAARSFALLTTGIELTGRLYATSAFGYSWKP